MKISCDPLSLMHATRFNDSTPIRDERRRKPPDGATVVKIAHVPERTSACNRLQRDGAAQSGTAGRPRHGQRQRLGRDEARRYAARCIWRRVRGARSLGASNARRDVRVRRRCGPARIARDHRRRRRCGTLAGHARGEDDGADPRRAGAIEIAARRGFDGVGTPTRVGRRHRPGGWRTAQPAVGRPSFCQREPVTRCPEVSKRMPATTM